MPKRKSKVFLEQGKERTEIAQVRMDRLVMYIDEVKYIILMRESKIDDFMEAAAQLPGVKVREYDPVLDEKKRRRHEDRTHAGQGGDDTAEGPEEGGRLPESGQSAGRDPDQD